MDLQLSGACFLVTGGSSGLGLATARRLVAEGAHVVLAARDRTTVEAAAAQTSASGPGRAVGVAGDLTDPALADVVVAAAHREFGRLDGALISSGGPDLGAATDVTDEQWRSAFELVLLGGVRVARAVAADLQQHGRGGSIAWVTSSSVRSPLPGLATSNALRPGVAMLAKTLADELGPSGIRVNTLVPGMISTPRLAHYVDSLTPEQRQARLAGIPLGRAGEPDEFGRVAAFVLSPAAAYVTGSVVTIDGGALRTH